MLNYENLNDVEFEYVCNDIMSRMLKTRLERFGAGKDGGVDLTNDAYKKDIIVQVKHYVKTDVKGLIRSLKSELPKIQELHPKQYYICCSKDLTPQNKSEIFDIFSDYMASTENIISRIEIDDFLSEEKNKDILRKHFKLWIESTSILTEILNNDIFIDCEALLYNIQNEEQLFVKTSAFEKAIDCLEKNNVLILLGNPGVGKTITSKMLVLQYAANGYRIRYTTDGADLASLKKAISTSKESKEVILLDDCFGQAYFNMKETQENELIALIKYVKMNPNKILIMNSRVTIYREATERTPNLVTSFENKEYKVYIIDMTNMSNLEKAKILYNHLYFKNVSNDFLFQIKKDKNYWKIIQHPNYNPRIIEYICTPHRLSNIIADEYMDFILKSLNNPEEVWKNEFERRLKDSDRILVTTLYSLSNSVISKEFLKTCYNHRIKSINGMDLSINQFEQALSRLSGSFVKLFDKNGEQMISIANPSINDFIRAHIEQNQPEQSSMIDSSITVQQLKRLLNKTDFATKINQMFLSKEILNFRFESEKQKTDYIVYYVSKYKILDDDFKVYVHNYLKDVSDVDIYEYLPARKIRVLEGLLSEELCQFYELVGIFRDFNLVDEILGILDLPDTIDFINAADWIFENYHRGTYIVFIQDIVLNKFKDYCDEISVEEYDFLVSDIIEECKYEDERGSHIDADKAIEDVEKLVKGKAKDQIDDYNFDLPLDLTINQTNLDEIKIHVSGADAIVYSYLNDDYDDDRRYDSYSSYIEIDNIFNR